MSLQNSLKQVQKGDPTYGVGINPISRLIQIQQAQKKKEPVYTLLAERGMPRRREFVMQVFIRWYLELIKKVTVRPAKTQISLGIRPI